MQYQLFHPDTEIRGKAILDFRKAVDSERFLPILEKYGLLSLKPNFWYPAQSWIDALNDMADNPGSPLDFVSMGMQQMELVDWPEESRTMSLTDILFQMDDIYHEYYRGTDIGSIQVQVISPTHIQVTVRSFEPDDLWYGNLYGLARRFLPKGILFSLAYGSETPRRELGGEHTIFHITWNLP
jgi:hypothetical protein